LALSETRNVQPFCKGISSRARRANLYTPVDGKIGWATLSADRYSAESVAETAIDLDTLDNLSREMRLEKYPVSLLKIDVEGHEADVLQGAIGVLNQWAPIVLIEVLEGAPGRASFEILNRCGYSHYYSFRRGMSSAGKGLSNYFQIVTRGLPVIFDAYDVSNPKPAALVCAVKPF